MSLAGTSKVDFVIKMAFERYRGYGGVLLMEKLSWEGFMEYYAIDKRARVSLVLIIISIDNDHS